LIVLCRVACLGLLPRVVFVLYFLLRRHPVSTLFPYTTLFRSRRPCTGPRRAARGWLEPRTARPRFGWSRSRVLCLAAPVRARRGLGLRSGRPGRVVPSATPWAPPRVPYARHPPGGGRGLGLTSPLPAGVQGPSSTIARCNGGRTRPIRGPTSEDPHAGADRARSSPRANVSES